LPDFLQLWLWSCRKNREDKHKMNDLLIFGKGTPEALASFCKEARKSIQVLSFVASVPSARSHLAYRALWQAMEAAPARGVACQILLCRATPDSTQGLSNRLAASTLRSYGWESRLSTDNRIHHAKIWIFDQKMIVIGSHNLTEAAMLRNVEFSLASTYSLAVSDTVEAFAGVWLAANKNG